MITKNAKKPSNSLVNIVVHLDWRRGFIEEHRGGTPKRFYVGVMSGMRPTICLAR